MWMVLSKEHIVNLLLGCSPLETVELFHFKDFSRFEIRSSKLKRNFIPYNDNGEINHFVEIVILGSHHVFKCRLVAISFVVNTKLMFDITSIKDIQYYTACYMSLIHVISNVSLVLTMEDMSISLHFRP
ncbi:hypothetical protein R3W88_008011 [Solanum pinnatisectum]|uniref:Uncharacterized protein n=1 Tax=Solanum pinnatisectum TaxID=50273 RepID=A0AAV9M6Q2_9SOLN|nr:hypothetical protein R3W88_008011 [Solanum pinnatisectum]